jgi:hypothetical protein
VDIYLLIESQQTGPFTEEQVQQSLAAGLIPGDLPAWHAGLTEWVQVESLIGAPSVVGGASTVSQELTTAPGMVSRTEPSKPFAPSSKLEAVQGRFTSYGFFGIGFVALVILGLSIGGGLGLFMVAAHFIHGDSRVREQVSRVPPTTHDLQQGRPHHQ